MLGLIAGQAAPFHGRPVLGVTDDGTVPSGNLGKVVPIASVAIERNVAVGQVQIERAIIVQVAELRAEAPAAQVDTHGGAAAQAEVEAGDLLVRFDGHWIGGVDDLHRLLIDSRIGASAPLELVRRGRLLTLNVVARESDAG